MRLHFGADEYVAAWVSERIPHMRGEPFGPCAAIAVLGDDGRMLGGVVYHNYRPRFRDIEMSAAADSKRWLTKEVLRGIFRYPFVQLQVRRVTMITGQRNDEARKLLRGLGFKQEGVIRRGLGNQDALVFGFMASEWRRSKFFEEKPLGQASAVRAASA